MFAPCLVNAQSGVDQLRQNLDKVGAGTNLSTDKEPVPIIASIINIVLGFLGILAVIFIIYAGFKWMTAQGNEQQVTDAKAIIKNAVIGIMIVLLSWVIVSFVIDRISESATTERTPTTIGGTGACTYSKFLFGETCKMMTKLQCDGKSNNHWDSNKTCPESEAPTGACRCADPFSCTSVTSEAEENSCDSDPDCVFDDGGSC